MLFDKQSYEIETITIGNETITIRAFRNRVYVEKPVCEEFQQINIFAPESFYQGESIHGYSLHTAPIFMPNMVGGYMPGGLGEPAGMPWDKEGTPNTIFRALQRGYVVVTPAIRGRILKNEAGKYIGKAPACVVDYKAAIRYLRHFSNDLPGDVEKIITNGTSAGGALSSLMGATGNHPDYEEYLSAIGAAKERDDIFAASCYCPIINLEHADMAYEWQFLDVNCYRRNKMVMDEGGRPTFTSVDDDMSKLQIKTSRELAEDVVVKMLNPMRYVEDAKATKTQHWRIRHGECDRDTSLAISAMLALKLKEQNCEVDYHAPWNVPHAGDYDLDELFACYFFGFNTWGEAQFHFSSYFSPSAGFV